jgi:hypothetical protein
MLIPRGTARSIKIALSLPLVMIAAARATAGRMGSAATGINSISSARHHLQQAVRSKRLPWDEDGSIRPTTDDLKIGMATFDLRLRPISLGLGP